MSISWKLQGFDMSNVNFLIADVIPFVSGLMTIFTQEDGTKRKFKQFSEYGSQTITNCFD